MEKAITKKRKYDNLTMNFDVPHLGSLKGHVAFVSSVCFDMQSQSIYSAGDDGNVITWTSKRIIASEKRKNVSGLFNDNVRENIDVNYWSDTSEEWE